MFQSRNRVMNKTNEHLFSHGDKTRTAKSYFVQIQDDDEIEERNDNTLEENPCKSFSPMFALVYLGILVYLGLIKDIMTGLHQAP